MPAFALGAAVSSMAAQNVGAGRWDRVGRIAGAGVAFHCVITGAMVLILVFLNKVALSLFLAPGHALDIAGHINLTSVWSFVFFGISMVLFGVVRSTGAVLPPLIILFITLWGIRLPVAIGLAPRLGADAIWWSFAGVGLAALLAFLYYRFGGWRRARRCRGRRLRDHRRGGRAGMMRDRRWLAVGWFALLISATALADVRVYAAGDVAERRGPLRRAWRRRRRR